MGGKEVRERKPRKGLFPAGWAQDSDLLGLCVASWGRGAGGVSLVRAASAVGMGQDPRAPAVLGYRAQEPFTAGSAQAWLEGLQAPGREPGPEAGPAGGGNENPSPESSRPQDSSLQGPRGES